MLMRAELTTFGFVVGGPKSEHWVATRAEANAKVTELAVAEGYEEDDYTVTEVCVKAWRGAFINPDGTLAEIGDWETTFKRQL